MSHPLDLNLDEYRLHAPQALPGQTNQPAGVERQLLCPFGCGYAQCDQNGYCDHLVGWTDHRLAPDGSGRELYERNRRVGERYQTGEQKRQPNEAGRVEEFGIYRAVQEGDVIVPMNNGKPGKFFQGTQWDRVYRRLKNETLVTRPKARKLASHPDVAELQNTVTNQDTLIQGLVARIEMLKTVMEKNGIEFGVEDEPAKAQASK